MTRKKQRKKRDLPVGFTTMPFSSDPSLQPESVGMEIMVLPFPYRRRRQTGWWKRDGKRGLELSRRFQ